MSYPTRDTHANAWVRLAREIAAAYDTGGTSAAAPGDGVRGRLTVLGSGIQTIGFTLGDREVIERADRVFFCVADPATVVWLKRLRPDAYDLYVLYDDRKPRYITYMQMAEAMLYGVRCGEHVVAIFYGHPGVFVLSTHRAIAIARREGHAAEMRPAVSALDCLCADLGIDPSNPGLQTHEATDLLVRRRTPDTTVHVVLWQVGLIGEMGFRRNGFLNRNFSTFVDYLQAHYGTSFPAVHYIASRYPTVPPLIERVALDTLHEPAAQARITGLSTFYLAPKDARAADPAIVARLGLLREGERVREPAGPMRAMDIYGARERRAIASFARFEVPEDYHWQEETAASDFLIELRSDVDLQANYATCPDAALATPQFAALSARERAMLATRDPGAIQMAAKGAGASSTSNGRLLLALVKDRGACTSLLQAAALPAAARQTLEEIAARLGESVSWSGLARDVTVLHRAHLLPWTGVYRDDRRQLALTILGSAARPRAALLFVNERRIGTFTFDRGVLEWRMSAGRPHNGYLRLEVTKGTRTIVGHIWTDGERPADRTIDAVEANPDRRGLGRHAFEAVAGGDGSRIAGAYVLRTPLARRARIVTVDADGSLTWTDGPARLFDGRLQFVTNPITQTVECFGWSRARDGRPAACYGSALETSNQSADLSGSTVPGWLLETLRRICADAQPKGGLLLWHKWEKHALTSHAINRVVTRLASTGDAVERV